MSAINSLYYQVAFLLKLIIFKKKFFTFKETFSIVKCDDELTKVWKG